MQRLYALHINRQIYKNLMLAILRTGLLLLSFPYVLSIVLFNQQIAHSLEEKNPLSTISECLDSEECKQSLDALAIEESGVIQELKDKIELIGKQIDYLEEKINYYSSRNWTDYITLDPVKFVQNIFGGGEVQKTQLTITDLQVKVDRLKTEQISLLEKVINKEEELKNKVTDLLFKITETEAKIALLEEQRETFNMQIQSFLIKYNKGEGTTNQYLSYQDKLDKFDFQLLTLKNDYQQTINKLKLLIDFDMVVDNGTQVHP